MMMRRVRAMGVMLAVLPALAAGAQTHDHAAHGSHQQGGTAASAASGRSGDEALPAGAEQAAEALEKSPRHGEWVEVQVPGSDQPIRTWIVYPERKEKAPVVIVIHEIFGLTDWIRAVADQLARDGFIGVAPDLLSGRGPDGGNTDSFASRDDVVAAVRALTPVEVSARLDAVRAHALALPASNGRSATVGFCWGGGVSFSYAASEPELDAAVVYYGTSPDAERLSSLKTPVLGLYGEDDARVNATIEPAAAALKRIGGIFETEMYAGAGHGFLRQQTGREGANRRATEQAWPRTLEFLRAHTK